MSVHDMIETEREGVKKEIEIEKKKKRAICLLECPKNNNKDKYQIKNKLDKLNNLVFSSRMNTSYKGKLIVNVNSTKLIFFPTRDS